MTTTADPPATTYVVRQPVMDAAGRVFGYELCFREVGAPVTPDGEDERSTARMLTDAILTIGLDTLTSKRPAFLTFNRELLLAGAPTLLPADAVIVCVRADLASDASVVAACQALCTAGYALAVEGTGPSDTALLDLATYLRVPVGGPAASPLDVIGPRSSGLQVVATHVDSPDTYRRASAAKCRLFQGFYFCEPVMRPTQALPARQLAYVNLLAALNKPSLTLAELEDLVKRDASLSVRVLRSVNSAAFATSREITSIRQALVLLGIDQVRKWASVWSLAGMTGGAPSEATSLALIRARCCELIGERLAGPDAAGEMFLLGLCSLLDALLCRPMELALADVQLPLDVRDALLGTQNFGRGVLDAVIAYERADWAKATALTERLEVPERVLSEAYSDALPWACQLTTAA